MMMQREKYQDVAIKIVAALALLVNIILLIGVMFAANKQEYLLYKRVDEGSRQKSHNHYYFMLTDGIEYSVPGRLYDALPQGAQADFTVSVLSHYIYAYETKDQYRSVVPDIVICFLLLCLLEHLHFRSKDEVIPYISCIVFGYLVFVL